MADVATAAPAASNAAPELTDAQKAEAEVLFATLEKEAEKARYNYMACRVPAAFIELFNEKYPSPTP